MDGLRESIVGFSGNVPGTTPKDVMDLLLLTQVGRKGGREVSRFWGGGGLSLSNLETPPFLRPSLLPSFPPSYFDMLNTVVGNNPTNLRHHPSLLHSLPPSLPPSLSP